MSMLHAYVRSLEVRNCSPETIRKSRGVLQGLERATRNQLELITAPEIADWWDARSRVLSPRSMRVQLVWVRGAYRWAIAEGRIEVDPTARLLPPKVPRLLPRPIPEDRLQVALDNADPRMRAILCLGAFAGLRIAEVASLTWPEVHLDVDEPVLRVMGKGRKERIVDAAPTVIEALLALPHRRGPLIVRADGRPGFNTASHLSNVANRYLRSVGIPDTYHSLRHRFGTAVVRAGGLRVGQEALGHASPVSTAGYASVLRGDMKAAILAAGSLKAS